MHRVEPRELLRRDGAALALAAVAPFAWWWAARTGLTPDVLDHDAGAGAVLAVRALRSRFSGGGFCPASALATAVAAILPISPIAAVRTTMALAAWAAGFGGWRLARAWRPELGPGVAALAGGVAQLGPWTVWPLVTGKVAALAAGPVLLALTVPALAPVLAFWSAPAAAMIAVEGMLSGSWPRRAAVVGVLLFLAPSTPQVGAAFQAAPASAPTSPAYGGTDGAWFPLPPLEATRWRSAAAWFDGRWVHPMGGAVSGSAATNLPAGALPLAIEAAVVPAAPRTVTPNVWLLASLPEGRLRAAIRGGGLEGAAVPIVVLATSLIACRLAGRRRLSVNLAALAMLSGLAALAVPAAEVRGVSGLELAGMGELPANVLFFPPPQAPWFAGRWSEAQVAAAAPSSVAPAATVVALARLCDVSFDTAGAGPAWDARAPESVADAAHADGLGGLVIDLGALPGWGRARVEQVLSATSGVESRQVGELRIVRFMPRSP